MGKKGKNNKIKNKEKELRKKGIELKNKSVTVFLPSVINNTILIESSLVVLLATLAEPSADNIFLYRSLLCTLVLSIALGVICTSIITIDFYNLGNKVLAKARNKPHEDNHETEPYIRTGKVPYILTILTFSLCLLLFLISLGLIVHYAW